MLLTVLGALAGGLATARRTGVLGDARDGTWSYLIDAAALLLCVAGVVVEARAISVLVGFFPGIGRQATLQLIGGVATGLAACILIPALRSDAVPGWLATGLAVLVYLGAARALSGAAGVAIAVAPGYLERRIDERLEEPW